MGWRAAEEEDHFDCKFSTLTPFGNLLLCLLFVFDCFNQTFCQETAAVGRYLLFACASRRCVGLEKTPSSSGLRPDHRGYLQCVTTMLTCSNTFVNKRERWSHKHVDDLISDHCLEPLEEATIANQRSSSYS